MKTYINNQTEVQLDGSTISDVLDNLTLHYPAIKPHIMDKNGNLRRYVNLFVNSDNIKDLHGIQTPVQETDKIILLPSISGG